MNKTAHVCMHACSVASVASDSLRPCGLQPTRLLHPWDFPGKSFGVGYYCLLQCMKVKNESEVAQSCPTLHDLMDCSLPGSSTHGIFWARVLEWGANCLLHWKAIHWCFANYLWEELDFFKISYLLQSNMYSPVYDQYWDSAM